jgi:hypothetical protein
MLAAIFTEFLGILDELVGLDHGRIVLVFLIAVEPGQDELDRFLVRAYELLTRRRRKIAILGERGTAAV